MFIDKDLWIQFEKGLKYQCIYKGIPFRIELHQEIETQHDMINERTVFSRTITIEYLEPVPFEIRGLTKIINKKIFDYIEVTNDDIRTWIDKHGE